MNGGGFPSCLAVGIRWGLYKVSVGIGRGHCVTASLGLGVGEGFFQGEAGGRVGRGEEGVFGGRRGEGLGMGEGLGRGGGGEARGRGGEGAGITPIQTFPHRGGRVGSGGGRRDGRKSGGRGWGSGREGEVGMGSGEGWVAAYARTRDRGMGCRIPSARGQGFDGRERDAPPS